MGCERDYFQLPGMSIRDILGPTAVDLLLELVNQSLTAAKRASQDHEPESFKQMISQLVLSLIAANTVCKTFGVYYNKKQDESGVIQNALDALFTDPWVRGLLYTVATTSGLGYLGSFFYGAYILALGLSGGALVFGYFLVLGVTFISLIQNLSVLPRGLVESSKGLRDAVASKLCVSLDTTAPVGIQEKFIHDSFFSHHHPAESLELYYKLIQLWYSGIPTDNIEGWDVARRFYLTILSSKLRQELKTMPIVAIFGVTTSGKSTLKEKLINPTNPNRKNFGEGMRNRTAVPDLAVCGNPHKSFCLLDTVGLSDRSIKSEETRNVIEATNNVFEAFVSAAIMVISHDEDGRNEVAEIQARKTSKFHDGRSKRARYPTLTCFNKADRLLDDDDGRPEMTREEVLQYLTHEAKLRINNDRPFDLRSMTESPYAPRVFSVFDKKKIPSSLVEKENMNSILVTEVEVQKWIEDLFYPPTTTST